MAMWRVEVMAASRLTRDECSMNRKMPHEKSEKSRSQKKNPKLKEKKKARMRFRELTLKK